MDNLDFFLVSLLYFMLILFSIVVIIGSIRAGAGSTSFGIFGGVNLISLVGWFLYAVLSGNFGDNMLIFLLAFIPFEVLIVSIIKKTIWRKDLEVRAQKKEKERREEEERKRAEEEERKRVKEEKMRQEEERLRREEEERRRVKEEERRQAEEKRRRDAEERLRRLWEEKQLHASLTDVDKMDGHQFEYYCADLLWQLDFTNVEVTKGSGDQGVDIIAVKDNIRYAIQCKRYSSHLGNSPVQEVNAGKQLYNCRVAVVLTNQYFTSGAKELAKATGVLLWDRDELKNMIRKAQGALAQS